MLIKRTTPAESFYDSYIVEIKTSTCKGDLNSYLTIGPFKRVPHEDNLQNLLETLQIMKTEGDFENYHWVKGFSQWFNTYISTFDALNGSYSVSAADFHTQEEHERIFALSRGFAKDWPVEPNTADLYYQTFDSFKVFYYDYTGTKYNTEVTF